MARLCQVAIGVNELGGAPGFKGRTLCVSMLLAILALIHPALAEEPLEAAGITEPISDVALSPAVPGLVSAWKFKEGDFVKQDEVIIELDNRMETLEVERRKLAMDNRKADLEALQSLFKKSSISVKKEDLDKAETEYKIAVAEHQMATEQLRKRLIVAPCAGYVVEIVRDVGEACEAYQPLVRVADPRRCYFVSNVEATAAGRLKLDQEVKLSIETAGEPVQCAGKVVFLSPVVDPASGLRKVKVLFDNADRKINPGVAGRMRF
jgi:RND family efflux transporter MFP subunit